MSGSNKPASRSKSYAAADTADADGVKVSIASSASPVAYTNAGADFNGAAIAAGGVLDLPRTISVSLSTSSGSYNTVAIVLTGRRGGHTVTESLTPTTQNGNETLRGAQAFDVLESVAIPAQVNASGAFTIGTQDICAPCGDVFSAVKVHADGTLYVGYGDVGTQSDAIPIVVANQNIERIAAARVLTGTGKTIVGVTVYL